MKRNPFLFVVLTLIIVGALFFRYMAPERSTQLIEVAAHVQRSAVQAVTAAVASVTATQPKKDGAALDAENARLIEEQQKLARIIENDLADGGERDLKEAELEVVERVPAENGEIDQAVERANALLKNAMQAAKEAREQIAIAQKELDSLSEARARLNPNAIAKSAPTSKERGAVQAPPQAEKAEKGAIPVRIESHAPATEIERILADSTIRFDWTKSALSDDAVMKINQVTELMRKNPEISVRIIGHTDSNGKEELNSWLGLIRARRVRQQLIARKIDPKRLSVSSRGSKDPVESNDTPMGRWKNRRVEFALSEK